MRLADGDVCLGDLIGYNKAYCACLVFVGYILTYCIFFKCIYMIYMHTDINIIYIYIFNIMYIYIVHVHIIHMYIYIHLFYAVSFHS